MSTDSGTRLTHRPRHTEDVLKAIVSGSRSREQIAEKLDIGTRTAQNKLHDPRHLGLIQKTEADEYKATEDARRLIQLQERDVLIPQFKELPGVPKIIEEAENGGITTEQAGRLVSFETGSGAADEDTFREYGRVYSRWMEYLELGEITDPDQQKQHPLDNPNGANHPKVSPQKIIEALPLLDKVDSREELAEQLEHSEREAGKILTTAYALDLARREAGGFSTNQIGREVTTSSRGNQQELLRERLLQLPFVEAYCARVPEGTFDPEDVMEQLSEDYTMGWNSTTVQTKSKRLAGWLTFCQLAERPQRGVLEPTEKMPRS